MMRVRDQRWWSFGLSWLIANAIGWGLYNIVALAAGWAAWQIYQYLETPFLGTGSTLIAFGIWGLVWPTIVGVLQQFALGRRLEIDGKGWALATTIGLILFMALEHLTLILDIIVGKPFYSVDPNSILVDISRLGSLLTLGLAQWIILRRYFKRAGWWIIVTAFALWLSALALDYGEGIALIVSPSARGLIYGVVTLAALAAIVKQPVRGPQQLHP